MTSHLQPQSPAGNPAAATPATPAKPPPPRAAGFHFHGQLPHLTRENASYFVTFQLADSLPASVIFRLKCEREILLADALANQRPLTWQEQQQLLAWHSEKVDRLLDAGLGDCRLHRPAVAELW